MAVPAFAIYKYRHPEAPSLSPAQKGQCALALGVGLCGFLAHPALGVTLTLASLIFIAWIWPKRKLQVGPRYFLCGSTLIYYRNVATVAVDAKKGVLALGLADGRRWHLDRDLFPTNARKAPKIAHNKEVKFKKIASKLVEKVLKVNPGIPITGAEALDPKFRQPAPS